MNLRLEWWLASRFLRAKRAEGFISVITGFSFLGLMLGVATLIVVMAVMNGFREELTSRILGINAHISITGNADGLLDYEALTQQFDALPFVTHAAPVLSGQVLATARGANSGVLVQGMKAEDLKRRDLIARNMVAGSLDALADVKYGAVLGIRLAQNLGVLPGDTVRLISPQTNQTALGAVPRIKDFTVVGIVEVGMYEYDSSTLFINLSAAQTYFQAANPPRVSSISLMTDDPNTVDARHSDIYSAVAGDYFISNWKQANSHFFQSLNVERNVMFLILSLIVAVAAFNIIAGLVMMVTDKTREIAILRTMGATRGSVLRVFIFTGSVVGVLGTLFGVLLGVGFATNIETIRQFLEGLTGTELFAAEIYFLSQLPAKMELTHVVNVVAMSLSLSFLATLYPAWKAAKTHPVEALSHE